MGDKDSYKSLYDFKPKFYSVKSDKTNIAHPLFSNDFISKSESEMNLWDKLPFLKKGKDIQELLKQMFPGGGTKLQSFGIHRRPSIKGIELHEKGLVPIPPARHGEYKLTPPIYKEEIEESWLDSLLKLLPQRPKKIERR